MTFVMIFDMRGFARYYLTRKDLNCSISPGNTDSGLGIHARREILFTPIAPKLRTE